MNESIQISSVRYSKVISTYDPTGSGRIKVFLSPEDRTKKGEDVAYAIPLMPKMFSVIPKVGEGVFVLTAIANNGYTQRYYIGPVITQPQNMEFESYENASAYFLNTDVAFGQNPNMNPETRGILNDEGDVVVEGRRSSGIQLKDNEVRIKAGVKISNPKNRSDIFFNEKSPSYVKLKYHEDPISDGVKTSVTIAGDKIALLSNTSKRYPFVLNDRKDLVTDSELEKIYEKAQRLPYGDDLVDFLKTFYNAFITHTHNFSTLPPNPAGYAALALEKEKMLDNKDILSDSIYIN